MNVHEKLLSFICLPNVQNMVLSSSACFQIWLFDSSGNLFDTLWKCKIIICSSFAYSQI